LLRKKKIAKIKTYERECLANWALVEDTFRATVKDDFVSKWLPDDDSPVDNAPDNNLEIEEKACQQLAQLSELCRDLEAVQFSGRRLTFEENKLAKLEHSFIGSLVIENLKLPENFQSILRDRNMSLSISMCLLIEEFLLFIIVYFIQFISVLFIAFKILKSEAS
jgi:seryl-tRNA synthetase